MNHGTLQPNLNTGNGSCNNWSTDHHWAVKRSTPALFLTAAYFEMLSLQIFS